jgi:hypothetical protein
MARELAGFNLYGCRVVALLGRHLYEVADAVTEALVLRCAFCDSWGLCSRETGLPVDIGRPCNI